MKLHQLRYVREVVRQGLNISQWKLVIGGSLGGMQTLEWALLYPELVKAIAVISASGRHSPWSIALGEIQRQAIYADPLWHNGNYSDDAPPNQGLAIARMIATCAYYSRPDFEQRFPREQNQVHNFAIADYLQSEGQKLVERFDANAYISLTTAMDTHDLSRDRGNYNQVLHSIYQPTLIVATSTDLLYFPEEQKQLAQLIPNANLANLASIHGHDAFLIDLEDLDSLLLNSLK